jgi:hypothetical protein
MGIEADFGRGSEKRAGFGVGKSQDERRGAKAPGAVWSMGGSVMAEKQSKKSAKGGARAGAGRPKGALDKGNALIREMIVEALNGVGGVQYLQTTANSHPAAFLALVGKVMPVQVEGGDVPIKHSMKVTFE